MRHGVMVMQAIIRRLWKNFKTLNTSIRKHVVQITLKILHYVCQRHVF
jgi:hypothetical protein